MTNTEMPRRRGLLARMFGRGEKPKDQTETVQHPTRILVMPGARMIATDRGTKLFPLVAPDSTSTDNTLHVEVSAGAAKMRGVQFLFSKLRTAHPSENVLVLTTGGREASGGSRSDEAAKQLRTKYGIPPESVISLGGEGSTLGNAAALTEYLRTHADILGNVSEVGLVENEYKILRAWLMFSAAMFTLTTGRDFKAPEEHKEEIRKILFSGGTAGVDDVETHMNKFTQVRGIFEKYFKESKVHINPIVVEEELEKGAEGLRQRDQYIREYVKKIRNDPSLLARLNPECQGAWDFLYEKYKTKDQRG